MRAVEEVKMGQMSGTVKEDDHASKLDAHPIMPHESSTQNSAHSELPKEERIRLATQEVRTNGMSTRKAASEFGIAPSTLLDRLSGKHKPAAEAHEDQMKLSKAQETSCSC
ncbi:hypothetical protein K435DRAFT_853481 [Dendrothele bispora CBS 962.96]|uniref:HTH psq-type domain-containing protein n=1 Tax=Dendrothele bispora (strain CBS 962.96) TaxID=1314807 RepID=A0A4S8MGI7_DENBC|nr:hypothetical protein K435DRAFT_853481 [Dendrothele bispora CBS 962.96]